MPLGRTQTRYNARKVFLYIWILKKIYRATCAIWLSRWFSRPTTRDFEMRAVIRKKNVERLAGRLRAFKAYLRFLHKKAIFYAKKCGFLSGVDNFLKLCVKCNGQNFNFWIL